MNCDDARHLIHLDAGNDLLAEEEHTLASHMERCADCRDYHSRMLKSMIALHVLRDFDSPVGISSKVRTADWRAMAKALPARVRRVPVTRRFNMQVVALSVCSLAMAVVTLVQALPASRPQNPSFAVPVRMASHSGQWNSGPSGVPGQSMPGAGAVVSGISAHESATDAPVHLGPLPFAADDVDATSQSF